MPWFIITVLFLFIGVAVATSSHRAYNRHAYGRPKPFPLVVTAGLWAAVGALVVGPLVTLFFIDQTSRDEPTAVELPIASLGDGTETSGRFFLGSGSIDTGPAYFYYTGNEVDGFRAHTIDAGGVDIKYTDGPPHMTAYCRDWTHAADWAFIPGWKWGSSPDDVWDDGCRSQDTGDIDVWVTFFVPAGSVQQNYTLDSQ